MKMFFKTLYKRRQCISLISFSSLFKREFNKLAVPCRYPLKLITNTPLYHVSPVPLQNEEKQLRAEEIKELEAVGKDNLTAAGGEILRRLKLDEEFVSRMVSSYSDIPPRYSTIDTLHDNYV